MPARGLADLPRDILITLPSFLHTLEDLNNLSSTCRELRLCMSDADPKLVLRLANASRHLFQPWPFVLLATTARQLGDWARQDPANEAELVAAMEQDTLSEDVCEDLLSLAVDKLGLTIARIRQFHELRKNVLSPLTSVMCDCTDLEWAPRENERRSWIDHGRHSAEIPPAMVIAEPDVVLLQLSIYAELFGPDLASLLEQEDSTQKKRKLSVDTRLTYMKYCIPGWSLRRCIDYSNRSNNSRTTIREIGPYRRLRHQKQPHKEVGNANELLRYTLRHPTWRKHWREFCQAADCEDAVLDTPRKFVDLSWREQLFLNIIMIQGGAEGFEMISPIIPMEERVEKWGPKIRTWSKLISWLGTQPRRTDVGRLTIPEIPCVIDELWVLEGNIVA